MQIDNANIRLRVEVNPLPAKDPQLLGTPSSTTPFATNPSDSSKGSLTHCTEISKIDPLMDAFITSCMVNAIAIFQRSVIACHEASCRIQIRHPNGTLQCSDKQRLPSNEPSLSLGSERADEDIDNGDQGN
ncbi:hypothetical protein CEXT_771551 [Caerostris extrusa]|uniref:Uncharacterized protein n=1 Tax=Caerostris extrusa TaxID=172846 RepID=A0AAV4YD90_CAEEX|nr:hypothetical protein CEXT_771551 [Caerostris extrusa]